MKSSGSSRFQLPMIELGLGLIFKTWALKAWLLFTLRSPVKLSFLPTSEIFFEPKIIRHRNLINLRSGRNFFLPDLKIKKLLGAKKKILQRNLIFYKKFSTSTKS